MLPPTPTQLHLVSIRFRRKISFVTSFTISNRLKKYYFWSAKFWKQYVKAHNVLFFKIKSLYH